jgi:hypothetical protein
VNSKWVWAIGGLVVGIVAMRYSTTVQGAVAKVLR